MQTKGWAFLRSLLNKFGHQLSPDTFKEMFLSDMADEEAAQILGLEITSSNPELVLRLPEQLLEMLHYSWLIPAIEKLPPFMQSRLVGLLPKEKQKPITEKLEITPKPGHYIEPIRKMILNKFFQKLDEGEVLPKEYLPESPLAPLLDLKKSECVTLIDLLGVHDLAEEMRGIVDQKKIKAVYRCLKPHQHRHLYLCLQQQEKVVSPPLDLGGWSGNCTTLQKKLHVRGIIRLAKALSGQHRNFIWYISHILDTGRASILQQHLHEEALPKITPALQQQILQTINYLNGKNRS